MGRKDLSYLRKLSSLSISIEMINFQFQFHIPSQSKNALTKFQVWGIETYKAVVLGIVSVF